MADFTVEIGFNCAKNIRPRHARSKHEVKQNFTLSSEFFKQVSWQWRELCVVFINVILFRKKVFGTMSMRETDVCYNHYYYAYTYTKLRSVIQFPINRLSDQWFIKPLSCRLWALPFACIIYTAAMTDAIAIKPPNPIIPSTTKPCLCWLLTDYVNLNKYSENRRR